MKNIGIVLSCFFFGAALLFSCSKEDSERPTPPKPSYEFDTLRFKAAFPSDPSSRLTVGEKLALSWSEDDKIAVFDGSAKNIFSIPADGISGDTAIFIGTVKRGSTSLYAVFPESAALSLDADGSLEVSVPSVQTIAPGDSLDASAIVAVTSAVAGDRLLSFRNIQSFVQVNIPDSGRISSVALSGAAKEFLAGTAKVGIAGDPSITALESSESVSIKAAEGYFDKGNYYIATAPAALPSGVKVSLLRNDAASGSLTMTSPVEFLRSHVIPIGNVVSSATWKNIITTKEQLFAWNEAYADWNAADSVYLGADIDMEQDASWIPHTFRGYFDGQDHCIYNINVRTTGTEIPKVNVHAAFFNVVSGAGEVKNIIFGSKDGIRYDNKSIFRHENTEELNNWYYVSPIGKLQDRARISGIKNFAVCETGKDDRTKTRVAGIVALSSSSGNISDCINYGAVRNLADTTLATTDAVAGIVADLDSTMVVENCENYGIITSANAYVAYVGGIVGQMNGGQRKVKPIVRGCKNFGKIQLINETRHFYDGSPTSSRSVIVNVGGVVGENDGGSVIACENSGALSSTHDNGQCMMAGIVGRYRNEKGADNCEISGCTNNTSGTVSLAEPSGRGCTSNHIIAGILANEPAATLATLTVRNCKNYAAISTSHSHAIAAGGICGYVNDSKHQLIVEGCENYGAVSITAKTRVTTNSNEAYCAGIIAWSNGGARTATDQSIVRNCKNSGELSASKPAKLMMGGIVGRSMSITIENCENSGNITDDTSCTDWRCIGGILGRDQQFGTTFDRTVIRNCSNSGTVKLLDSKLTSSPMSAAGGILAAARPCIEIYGCTNTGDVYSQSIAAAGTGYAIAGGILGYDNEGITSGNGYAVAKMEGCKNYGKVSAETQNEAKTVAAGGIAGYLGAAKSDVSSWSGNFSYGDVFAQSAGSTPAAALGGAGAVVGYLLNTADWGSTSVSKGLKVNGVSYASAASISELDYWLCPSNAAPANLNVTYVEQ